MTGLPIKQQIISILSNRRIAPVVTASFVGTPTGNFGQGSRTATFPTGWVAGDTAYLWHLSAGELEADAPVTPTGWTKEGATQIVGTSSYRLYRKVLAAGDAAPTMPLASGLNIRTGLMCFIVKNAVLDVTTVQNTTTNTTSIPAPTATPTVAGSLLVRLWGEKSGSNTAWTGPGTAGLTFTGFLGAASTGVVSGAIGTALLGNSVAAVGVSTAVKSVASVNNIGITLLFKPAAVAVNPDVPVVDPEEPINASAMISGASVYPNGNWSAEFDKSQVMFTGLAGVRIFIGQGAGMGSWTSGNVAKTMTARGVHLIVSAQDFNYAQLVQFFINKPPPTDGRKLYYTYHHEPDGGFGGADFALDATTGKRQVWLDRQYQLRQAWVEAGSRPDILVGPILIRHTLTNAPGKDINEWMPYLVADSVAVRKQKCQDLWHFVGFDAYNQATNGYAAPSGFINIVRDHARNNCGLPWAIGEMGGVLVGPAGSTDAQKHALFAQYITDYHEWCRTQGDALYCLLWSAYDANTGYDSRINKPGFEAEQQALAAQCKKSREALDIPYP